VKTETPPSARNFRACIGGTLEDGRIRGLPTRASL